MLGIAMTVFSRREAAAWYQGHHVALNIWGLPDRIGVNLKFESPADAQARLSLVKQAMEGFSDEPWYLVWFDDWSVWPPLSECTSLIGFPCLTEKHVS
jgi:hypothetical protein